MTRPARHDPSLAYAEWSAASNEAGTATGLTPQVLLRVVRARGWIIGLTTALSFFGGALYLGARAPTYLSTTQLIVDPRELQGVNGSATPRTENPDITEAVLGNEMRVLKSNTLLSALIDKDGLTDDPDFAGRISGLTRMEGILALALGHRPSSPVGEGDARLHALAKLNDAIAVRRAERSFVVDVTVRTSNAAKSARLANNLVVLYIQHAIDTTSGLNRRVGDALQNRLSELQDRSRAADQRVEQFRIANRLVSAGGVLTSDLKLRTLSDQLTIAQSQEQADRARAEAIARLDADRKLGTAPEAQQSAGVTQLRARLADAIAKADTLARQLGPRHPDLIMAREQVAANQQLIEAELQRVAAATRNQYGRSRDNADNIRQGVDTLSTLSLNNSAIVAQLRQLEEAADGARTLYTAFLSRSRELSEQTEVYASNTRQIDMALPAIASSNLPSSVLLLIVLVFGLALGSAIAGGLELRDRLSPGSAAGRARTLLA